MAAGRAVMWRGVFAVFYTYNRKELVAQCLDSIRRQSLPPDRIVLVDNGSTDGTRDHLAKEGLLDDPRLEYVRLDANTGAAGGLRQLDLPLTSADHRLARKKLSLDPWAYIGGRIARKRPPGLVHASFSEVKESSFDGRCRSNIVIAG